MTSAKDRVLDLASVAFDRIEGFWDGARGTRTVGTALVVAFVGSLAAIELNRQGLLPAAIGAALPTTHFGAIGVVFSLLLGAEVIGLVLALARSVAESLGKQFEVFALILLRKAFVEYAHLGEPLAWNDVAQALPHVLTDMAGALGVFVLLAVYNRVQRHRAITVHAPDLANFIRAKKLLATVLLVIFAAMIASALWTMLRGEQPAHVFGRFYTVLVFSDVLIVLVSLRYSSKFHVVFRNSGFAAATTIVRLALSAPAYVGALLGVGAIAFAVATSLAYNFFERREPAPEPAALAAEHPPSRAVASSAGGAHD